MNIRLKMLMLSVCSPLFCLCILPCPVLAFVMLREGKTLLVVAIALCCERQRQARAKLNSCSVLRSVSVLVEGDRVPGKLPKVGNLDREKKSRAQW